MGLLRRLADWLTLRDYEDAKAAPLQPITRTDLDHMSRDADRAVHALDKRHRRILSRALRRSVRVIR